MKIWKAVLLTLLAVAIAGAIGGVPLIRRSFRAIAKPFALEPVIALASRNLAVPLPNQGPLEAAPENPQGARDLHPRVPDLRAAQAKNLTNGDIHHIIENGVQLTGMPAWGNPHRKSDIDRWKLTLFVQTPRSLTNQEKTQQASTAVSAHYVGSQACEKCHAQIYERWKKTPMANVVRDPRTHPHAILADFSNPPSFVTFKKQQIAFVYGNIWKQNYFTKVGDEYYPLPAKWDIAHKKWMPYLVKEDWWTAFYPPRNADRPTGPTCNGCHSVNYNIQTHTVTEWNVGCERCHGPGSEHVEHPTRGNILNSASMDSFAANNTCIQCHSQGRPLQNPIQSQAYDWPVGYHVGLKLQNFWKLEAIKLGGTNFYYFADGTAHKNRMQGNDFMQSVMYRHRITCSNCHDVHGTDNYAELRKPANRICLDCHGPLSTNGPHTATIEEHTHHKDGTPGSECVDCHMPKVETEGVPGAYVHAHTFRFITPAMTNKYNIPNPCTSCHQGKSNTWATNQLRGWRNVSPWRIEQ